ncbi:unnamed protein product, partial [Prorocentrum cordatum]
ELAELPEEAEENELPEQPEPEGSDEDSGDEPETRGPLAAKGAPKLEDTEPVTAPEMVSLGALARDLQPVTSRFRATMAAELRTARNGQAYSYEEFIAHCGQRRGETKWAEAAPADRPERSPRRWGTWAGAAPVDPAVDPNSLAIVPAVVAVAAAPAARPAQVRVGPSKHGYVYERTELMHGGEPIYMCCRGREVGSHGRLSLVFLGSHWEAGEVPMGNMLLLASASDIVNSMEAAFRAAPDQDVLADGWHSWQCYAPREGTWWPSSEFQTTVLM